MTTQGFHPEPILDRLDQLIRAAVPDVTSLPKYGGTLYTLKPDEKEGQFCGIFPYKAHVQLAFSHGTALRDPNQVLEGTGKFRRHVTFTSSEQIDPEILAELLGNAVQLSLSGQAS